jgi:hypothetical protein
MTIEEKAREIMLSKELSNSEKIDRFYALIPPGHVQDRQPKHGDPRAGQAIERRLSRDRCDARDQTRRLLGKRS